MITANAYYDTQAYFNKWLKELTESERGQIESMLEEYATLRLNETKEVKTKEEIKESLQKEIKPMMLEYVANDKRSEIFNFYLSKIPEKEQEIIYELLADLTALIVKTVIEKMLTLCQSQGGFSEKDLANVIRWTLDESDSVTPIFWKDLKDEKLKQEFLAGLVKEYFKSNEPDPHHNDQPEQPY